MTTPNALLQVTAIASSLFPTMSTTSSGAALAAGGSQTATPIEHVVVIFRENVSFDHYFAAYPVGLNPDGEPSFKAAPGTPSVNGLGTLTNGVPSGLLLTDNPTANNTAKQRSV